jgi:hypothetical protein
MMATETARKKYHPRKGEARPGKNSLPQAAIDATPGQGNPLIRWREDPVMFVREVLGVRPSAENPRLDITPQQIKGLEAIRDLVKARVMKYNGEPIPPELAEYVGKRGLSITSGQGTGKDGFAAWVLIWILVCFPRPKVMVTAPAAHQIESITFAEVYKWLNRRNEKGDRICPLWQLITVQTQKIFLNETGGKDTFIEGRTARPNASAEEQSETLAGRHEDYFFVLAEEASGIPDPVFKPLEGTMTGKCNLEILIFNPTRRRGYAFNSQWGQNKDQYIRLRWDAEESPIVDQGNVKRMAEKYGRSSNTFRIRVKGLPPLSEDGTLIPWDWVDQSFESEFEVPEDTPLVMGVDVGRQGDPSVVVLRQGPKVRKPVEIRRDDTTELTGILLGIITDEEPEAVFLDVNGLGWGVYDLLTKLTSRVIIPVNVAESATDSEKFYGLRDELWWRCREKFEAGLLQVDRDEDLQGELTNPRYEVGPDGRIKVESKKSMKNRGLPSPNKADALCLTFTWPDENFKKKKPGADGLKLRGKIWRPAVKHGWMGK